MQDAPETAAWQVKFSLMNALFVKVAESVRGEKGRLDFKGESA